MLFKCGNYKNDIFAGFRTKKEVADEKEKTEENANANE